MSEQVEQIRKRWLSCKAESESRKRMSRQQAKWMKRYVRDVGMLLTERNYFIAGRKSTGGPP